MDISKRNGRISERNVSHSFHKWNVLQVWRCRLAAYIRRDNDERYTPMSKLQLINAVHIYLLFLKLQTSWTCHNSNVIWSIWPLPESICMLKANLTPVELLGNNNTRNASQLTAKTIVFLEFLAGICLYWNYLIISKINVQ